MSTELRVAVITLGCPKNLVDSEHLLGHLEAEGYVLEHDEARADVLIVNTCAFVQDADQVYHRVTAMQHAVELALVMHVGLDDFGRRQRPQRLRVVAVTGGNANLKT